MRVNGSEYWIVVRGAVDQTSHVDAQGRPVERHCLQLFASEAVRDAGAYHRAVALSRLRLVDEVAAARRRMPDAGIERAEVRSP